MKIIDILKQDTLSMSFEVFPPKTDAAFDSVKTATEEIAALSPSFMSVTYGAGGGTSAYTLEIARNIEAMKAAGIHNVMALRGDLTPELEGADRSNWPYRYAVDLIRELVESGGDFCIGGACYPEVHPESVNQKEDIAHIKAKVEAGCQFLTTQMFFDNNLFYNFMYKIREAGITVPIIPGIMPITAANQVERAVKLSGSFMPQRFKSLVDKFGHSPAAMKQAGIAYATDQIIDLYANGVTNIHVYTMNKPDVAAQIQRNLSDILGK